MKIKTSRLTGAALDWAVCKALGQYQPPFDEYTYVWLSQHRYSTDWSKGGPILEWECMDVDCVPDGKDRFWQAWQGDYRANGPTLLIAAMRCYVASKLGDEVDVPKGLP